MSSLKERLQTRVDISQKEIVLESAGGEKVTIRRLLLSERNTLMNRFTKEGVGQTGEDKASYSVAVISLSVVPPEFEEDILQLPAAVADELAEKIMDFNGWTERGRKELADQFRTTTGPSV